MFNEKGLRRCKSGMACWGVAAQVLSEEGFGPGWIRLHKELNESSRSQTGWGWMHRLCSGVHLRRVSILDDYRRSYHIWGNWEANDDCA